jgi:hypothetical protein
VCRGKCCVCGQKTLKRVNERGSGIVVFADLCERHYAEWLKPGARLADIVARAGV